MYRLKRQQSPKEHQMYWEQPPKQPQRLLQPQHQLSLGQAAPDVEPLTAPWLRARVARGPQLHLGVLVVLLSLVPATLCTLPPARYGWDR